MFDHRGEEPLYWNVPVKKRRNRDIAYLIILLTILFATFIFAIIVVNNAFRTLGI